MLRMIFIDFTVYGRASVSLNGRGKGQISSDDQDSNTAMWRMKYQ